MTETPQVWERSSALRLRICRETVKNRYRGLPEAMRDERQSTIPRQERSFEMIPCAMMLVALLAGQADAPAAEDLRAEVERLVRRLDAPQLAEREAAEAELLRRGPAMLDLLPPMTDRTPAEVRQRLGRVREQLQRQAADAAADASTITLRADAMPLSKIIAAFQQQSGNAIIDGRGRFGQPATDPPLKVKFDKTPFWPALDQVLDQAGLTRLSVFRAAGDPDRRRRADNRRARHGRACYSGPFRIEPTDVVARRGLRRPEDQSLVVGVEVGLGAAAAGDSTRQPHGRRHGDRQSRKARCRWPTPRPSSKRPARIRRTAVKFDLPFRLPPRDVRQIASLKGKLTATIAGKIETFRFRQPGRREKRRAAHRRRDRHAGRGPKDRPGLRRPHAVRFDDAGDALASHRNWIFDNPAFLESARRQADRLRQLRHHRPEQERGRPRLPVRHRAAAGPIPLRLPNPRHDHQSRL